MTSRPQFLAAAKGVSEARGAVVVQRLDRGDDMPVVRLGFTATRKIGNAVVRNRAKRRLREAARAMAPMLASPAVTMSSSLAHGYGGPSLGPFA
jgi:ribonuclease P protein component